MNIFHRCFIHTQEYSDISKLQRNEQCKNDELKVEQLSITIGNVHNGPTEEEETQPSALVILSTTIH